jgi:hypothetical protein
VPPVPVPGDHVPDPLQNCGSKACSVALSAVVNARNVVMFKCGQVSSAKSWMNTLAAISASLAGLAFLAFGAAAGAFALGLVFGFVLWKVLVAIGLSLLATALLFGVLAGIAALRLLVLEGELNGARADFTTATASVMRSCGPECWGDLTLPAC